jgi:hypothetical protein
MKFKKNFFGDFSGKSVIFSTCGSIRQFKKFWLWIPEYDVNLLSLKRIYAVIFSPIISYF